MFGNKLKNIIKQDENPEGNNKKKIENLVFFIVVLIITIVVINVIWNGNNKTNNQETNIVNKKLAESQDTPSGTSELKNNNIQNELESKLEKILSKIQGVGEVQVCINYQESAEVVAMYNENSKTSSTEETDTSGGTRKIEEIDTQKDIIYKENNGEKTPITKKVIQPKIEGAIITAKGANNAETKTNIIQAVEAVTGLATHKIQVFKLKV